MCHALQLDRCCWGAVMRMFCSSYVGWEVDLCKTFFSSECLQEDNFLFFIFATLMGNRSLLMASLRLPSQYMQSTSKSSIKQHPKFLEAHYSSSHLHGTFPGRWNTNSSISAKEEKCCFFTYAPDLVKYFKKAT